MRLPVRSETDAFRITYGIAFLVGVSLAVGLLFSPVWGAVLFTALTLGVLLVDLVAKDPQRPLPLQAAAHGPHPEATADAWRILVVANESLEGDEVRAAILGRAKLRPELMVVAPVLVSRTHFVTTDVDGRAKGSPRRSTGRAHIVSPRAATSAIRCIRCSPSRTTCGASGPTR
jgi:hypothetical protein